MLTNRFVEICSTTLTTAPRRPHFASLDRIKNEGGGLFISQIYVICKVVATQRIRRFGMHLWLVTLVARKLISGTAIGRDYAGEQENCKIKNCGGIKGITTNENSRTRHLLVAPILCPISEAMLKIGGAISSLPKQHHQLNAFCADRQNKMVSSHLKVFEIYLSFSETEVPFQNMITGQIFPNEITESLESFEQVGSEMYKDFVTQRLQQGSTKSILADPLKKANLKTCKSANKKHTMKVHDKIVELRGNCNLFARCALMQKK